ncbi:hypothetical protein [Stutzerimonas xanthomarina]|uniref:hypothetical protein n=1 Tax=Stutzerimonas xanthomarina TaxID=271420 RepID=UPI003AA97C49
MDSADQTQQTLVYADGYSYTEFFQAPELPGAPDGHRLISVFHAFFTPDRQPVFNAVEPPAEEVPDAHTPADQLA